MKGKRQEAILELVKKYEIETQEELAECIKYKVAMCTA